MLWSSIFVTLMAKKFTFYYGITPSLFTMLYVPDKEFGIR